MFPSIDGSFGRVHVNVAKAHARMAYVIEKEQNIGVPADMNSVGFPTASGVDIKTMER